MPAIYNLPFDKFIDRLSSTKSATLANDVEKICTEGKIDKKMWFADSNHKLTSKTHNIYTTLSNVKKVNRVISKLSNRSARPIGKNNSPYTFKREDHTFKLFIDGAISIPATATTTAMQERGSAWIIRRAISDNKRYLKWQDIILDEKYGELCKLYPNHTFEWVKVFFTQHQKMLNEYSQFEFQEYNRDGGFMKFITDLLKEKYNITHKDAWNPADIWMIKGKSIEIEKKIKDKLEGRKTQTISELNTILRVLFRMRIVVGISLKKTSGTQAFYEELNTKIRYPVFPNSLSYTLNDIVFKFDTQDTVIRIKGAERKTFVIQIKANDSKKLSALKWEASVYGASAKLGKVPIEMLGKLMNEIGTKLDNSYRNFPINEEEFESEKEQYWKMFNYIKANSSGKFTTDPSTVKEDSFKTKMKEIFSNQGDHVGNSKCMQLHFIYTFIAALKDIEQINDFLTDMIYLAEKRGQKFGPFGKLY